MRCSFSSQRYHFRNHCLHLCDSKLRLDNDDFPNNDFVADGPCFCSYDSTQIVWSIFSCYSPFVLLVDRTKTHSQQIPQDTTTIVVAQSINIHRNMSRRSTLGPTTAVPSVTSTATDMSKALNGLQSLSITDTLRGSQKDTSTNTESGYTTVQYTKPRKSSSQVKSFKAGSRAIPSATLSIAGQGDFSSPANQKNVNHSTSTGPPPASGRGKSTFGAQRLGSILETPSAAAISRFSAYTSNDWRSKANPRPVFRDLDDIGGPAKRNPNFKKVYPKDFYHVGMIVRANLHEDDFKGASSEMTTVSTIPNKSITPSVFGDIHTKERKMIVVACYNRNYIAIPLFTHNNKGLVNKKADEYISVRDHRDRSPNFREQSKHGHLLTEYLHDGINLFKPLSTAHITYPLSRSYDIAVIHE